MAWPAGRSRTPISELLFMAAGLSHSAGLVSTIAVIPCLLTPHACFDRLTRLRPICHSRHGPKPSIIYVEVLGLGTRIALASGS